MSYYDAFLISESDKVEAKSDLRNQYFREKKILDMDKDELLFVIYFYKKSLESKFDKCKT